MIQIAMQTATCAISPEPYSNWRFAQVAQSFDQSTGTRTSDKIKSRISGTVTSLAARKGCFGEVMTNEGALAPT